VQLPQIPDETADAAMDRMQQHVMEAHGGWDVKLPERVVACRSATASVCVSGGFLLHCSALGGGTGCYSVCVSGGDLLRCVSGGLLCARRLRIAACCWVC